MKLRLLDPYPGETLPSAVAVFLDPGHHTEMDGGTEGAERRWQQGEDACICSHPLRYGGKLLRAQTDEEQGVSCLIPGFSTARTTPEDLTPTVYSRWCSLPQSFLEVMLGSDRVIIKPNLATDTSQIRAVTLTDSL